MRGTVLVVDDNPLNLELFTVLLEEDGFDVVVAKDAEAALPLLGIPALAVVLIDLQLPGISGLEFLCQLRAGAHRDLCAVVVTSHAMDADRDSAYAAGADGYLSKPIDTRTFVATVRDLIGRRRR